MLRVQANSGQCRPETIPAVVEGGTENCRSKWSAVGRVCIKPALLKKGSIGWRARTRLGSFRGHGLFRPLCCEILDPLEFERHRLAFPDDSRPFTLVEG